MSAVELFCCFFTCELWSLNRLTSLLPLSFVIVLGVDTIIDEMKAFAGVIPGRPRSYEHTQLDRLNLTMGH